MKNVKYIVSAITLFLLIGTSSAFAQDSQLGDKSKDVMKEQRDKLNDKKKDASDQADAMKDKADAKRDKIKNSGDKVKGGLNDAANDAANDISTGNSDVMKDKRDAMKKEADRLRNQRKDISDKYNEKLKNAKSDDDRAAIKAAMDKEVGALNDQIKDAQTELKEIKDLKDDVADAKDEAREIKKNTDKGAPDSPKYGDLEGKDLALAKRKAAKAKLIKKQQDITAKQAMLNKGRDKIKAAKERFASAVSDGKLTKEEIAKKQATIDRAEANLNKLDQSLKTGKSTLDKQAETLDAVYKEN